MPAKALSQYLDEVEAAFIKLSIGYIERYEEECLTPERINLRIRVRFTKGHMLEWNEAIIGVQGHISHLAYRYHFQNRDNKVIFRYDNTPHFPDLEAFPNHKHLPDEVVPARRPSVREVLAEIDQLLGP